MTRYALLLRGINVGRAKRVGMADLRDTLTSAGFEDVATLLMSGNVVAASPLRPGEAGHVAERAIKARFGFPVNVVIRTQDEIEDVLMTNPLGDVATEGSRYNVAFMSGPPPANLVSVLEATSPGNDQWAVRGSEIYVWSPDGQLASPVMQVLAKFKGGPVTTVRNWNTVEKLAALLDR